jgi:hypothetical protein
MRPITLGSAFRHLSSNHVAITTPENEEMYPRRCGPIAEALLAHLHPQNRRPFLRADPVAPRGQTGPNLQLVTLTLVFFIVADVLLAIDKY